MSLNTKTPLGHLIILFIFFFISNCSPKLKFDPAKPMIFGRFNLHPTSPNGKNFKITKAENCEIVYGPRTGMAYNLAKIYSEGIFFINSEENLKIMSINCFPNYPNKNPVYSFEDLSDAFDYNQNIKNNNSKVIYIGDFNIVSTKGYYLRQKTMGLAIDGVIAAGYKKHQITTEDRFIYSLKEAKSILKEKFNLSLSDDNFIRDKNH
jgi:hypothetical protein